MTTITVTIPPGTTITYQQVIKAQGDLPDAVVAFIFEELGSRLGEPGEHTIEIPAEMAWQGEQIAAVVGGLLGGCKA